MFSLRRKEKRCHYKEDLLYKEDSLVSHQGAGCCSNGRLPSQPVDPLIRMLWALGATADQSCLRVALSI